MSTLEAKSSLFYVLVPYTETDLRAKLKKDGMVFHWSTGDQRCPPRCSACETGLPSFVFFTRDATIAAKTGLELSPSAKALVARTPGQLDASRADSAMVRVPLPPGRVLRPYQLAAVAYAASRPGVLIGDEMGCVAGSTVIAFNRAKRGFRMSIEDAYLRFADKKEPGSRLGWNKTFPTFARALVNGELHQHEVLDIIDQGVKHVMKLVLADGKKLLLTPDHEVALEGAVWRQARDLRPGDRVLTNGTAVCKDCGSPEGVSTYKYARFPGICRKCMYEKYRINGRYITGRIIDKDGYVRVSGHQGHPRAQEGGQVYEHILVMEDLIKRPVTVEEHIHHKDGNRANNAPGNLEIVSVSDHHRRHSKWRNMEGGTAGKGGRIKFIPSVSEVVSCTPAGREHVYDMVMKDPWRNFVANGIVVHNCGKTCEAIAIANTMPETSRILVVCPASLKANWRKEIMGWDAHNPRVILCEVGDDVPDPAPGREWCVTNAERLISTRARTAENVIKKLAPDREGSKLAKLVKAGERQRILWVAWPDVPVPAFPEGVLYSVGYSPGELVFASHPGPIIVRVPPGGVAPVILQDQPFGWTHVVGETSHNLAGAERAGNLWQILMATTWDLLILDEAHRFVNLKASTSERVLGVRRGRKREAALGIAQRSKKILALTGTPIPNRVRNLWALVSVLAPDAFKKEGDFLFRYCGPTKEKIFVKGGRGKQIEVMNFDGATNLDELQTRLRSTVMIRRLKEDVLSDLPAKTRQILPLSGDKIRDAADAEREAWLKLVPSMSDTVLEAMLAEAVGDAFAFEQALTRLQTDLSGIDAKAIAKERQATALAKVPLVVEHVRDALDASPRKVVIAAHHQSVIRAFEEAFGPMAVSLYGETPVKERQGVVDRFQTDPAVRVFIAGMHAAGVGITLTAADLMVFAEGDWLPWVLLQMEDRIHRIGQYLPVMIQYLVVDGSIEALIIASALQKQAVIDLALDSQPAVPRKTSPQATPEKRERAQAALVTWQTPGLLPERVSQFVAPMLARAKKRPLTDGEVWLCQQIAIQNPKSLSTAMLQALTT